MGWLRRHGWWGLLVVTVMLALFGITDIARGAADVGIPQGLTGTASHQALGVEASR